MSRQILDSSVLDQMLKQRGFKVTDKKPCCGKPAPIKSYARYLKQLGYSGDFAIKTNGVITEMGHIQ